MVTETVMAMVTAPEMDTEMGVVMVTALEMVVATKNMQTPTMITASTTFVIQLNSNALTPAIVLTLN